VGTVLARYYDPAIGQFLTVDPDVAATLSPYGYLAGNPLNGTDPSGDCGGLFGFVCTAWDATGGNVVHAAQSLCLRNPFGGNNGNGGCQTVLSTSQGATALAITAAAGLTIATLGAAAPEEVAAEGAGESAEAAATDGASSAADAAGEPPGYNPDTWDTGPASQESNSETHYWDENGGEWRWHAPDDWHSVGHWDYNPWDEWNSPWQNIYPETAMLIGPGAC
jgi:uncharacterized protein RhaS with RHS repeats